jgi:hypothetical protein
MVEAAMAARYQHQTTPIRKTIAQTRLARSSGGT